MNKKINYFLSFVALLFLQGVVAQNVTISGLVSDTSGGPLPGVNVVEKGTSNGTSTDFDGNYTINVSSGSAVLVFSSLGYSNKEIAVNSQTTINAALDEDASQLDEVVVTALGIKRDQKTLGYAVTQLGGEALSEVKTTNAINALQGKVAGVNITQPSTGAGGTSRVVIRGASSFSGDNQPLYVVDGITIDNSQLGAASEWGGSDFGDGVSSINPDDIKSISVLKGGAAGALYGSRASNGVIIITTKNGEREKGLGVEFSSQVSFDQINSNVRDFQNQFGQGLLGVAPTTRDAALNAAFSAWGPRLGSIPTSVQFDGESRPFVDQGDNLDRFYRTGTTLINTISLSKGGEGFNYRFGVTNLDNEDIQPNSGLNRKSFSLNLSSTVADKLSLDVSARYTIEKVNNRPRVSDSPGNANFSAGLLPSNINVLDLNSETGGANEETGFEEQYSANIFQTNPFWAATRFRTFDRRNRLLASATLNYQILDWLSITGRAGIDNNSTRSTQIEGFGTLFQITPEGAGGGSIAERQINITQVDADILLNINKDITDKFAVDAVFGANRNTQRTDRLDLFGSRFNVPFFENLNFVDNASRSQNLAELALSGVYGSVGFSYADYLFLTVTGRNDWFSTLSARGKESPNNEFYPSVNTSFVFSDAFETPSWLTFGKLRAGYSEVAGGADVPYRLSLPFQIFGQGHLGQPLGQIATGTLPNPGLTPFSKEETEVGLDIRLFDNRLGIDVAYYTNTTTRDIVNVDISNGSGFQNVASNIGEIENKGIELLLTGTPIKTKNFSWNTSFNLGFNDSEIVATDEVGGNINVGNVRTFDANITQIVGERFGVIFGTSYLRDGGQIVYNADGLPVINPERQILGEGVPPLTLGFTNTFNYNNFSLSFLVDGKFGGQVYAGTNSLALGAGLDRRTLVGREVGLTVTGVDESGAPFTFTHDDSTLQAYYGRLARIAEEVVEDADFIKLRQLSIGYGIPKKALENTFINDARVSFIGRNLFFIQRDSENIDPEAGFNAGNAQGLEFFGLPSTRSYGFSVNVKF